MSDRKKELASIGKAFSFEDAPNYTRIVCPYYRKAPFGMLRCMGSSITGRCGHPAMICPIPPSIKPVRLSDILEVD